VVTPLSRLPADIADAWFSFGPAVVIVLAGAQQFAWSHWPVYAGALVAEMLFDMASTVGRCWFGEGIQPEVMLPRLSWVYAVDAGLAPVGLIIAASAGMAPAIPTVCAMNRSRSRRGLSRPAMPTAR
jgi:hypothetical protein